MSRTKVVVRRRYARGYRNIERDHAAVVLRHVRSDRIAAELRLRFEESKIETIRVVVERPGRPESRDSATDDGNPSRRAAGRFAHVPTLPSLAATSSIGAMGVEGGGPGSCRAPCDPPPID